MNTPRTDAEQWHDGMVYVVEASFARQLETELAAAIEQKKAFEAAAKRLEAFLKRVRAQRDRAIWMASQPKAQDSQ